jgi:hypothetical protein
LPSAVAADACFQRVTFHFKQWGCAQGDLPCGTTVICRSDEYEAGERHGGPDAPSPATPAPPASAAIDPTLVGTWEIMVPSDRGLSRWIWRIMEDGTYKFRAEGPRAARPHEGTITAMNGHWSIHAIKGLADYNDGGSYEVRDTTAVITGKLGTGYWKRSSQ